MKSPTRILILALLACAAFGQPQPVVRGTASSLIIIGAEGIIATETMPGRVVIKLDTAATQDMIAREFAASLKAAPIGGAPLKGSAQLDFPAIVDGTCSGYMNFQLPGVAAGDALAPVWPDMEAGVEPGAMRAIGPGLVGVKICFFSSGPVQQKSIDPTPKVFGAAVVR